MAPNEGTRQPLRARHGPRGHRHPIRRREDAHEGIEPKPPRPRPFQIRREGVGVEEGVRKSDHHPAPFPRLVRRLVEGTIHHGRHVQPCGRGGVQSIPRGRIAVQGESVGELELRAQVGHFGHRGGLHRFGGQDVSGGQDAQGQPRRSQGPVRVRNPDLLRVPHRRFRRGPRGRDHPSRDHAGRHGRGHPPRRPALQAPPRQACHSPL
mmetsp:Transcript_24044/g.44457  ORF Transcript_24044/g.44457 Transcript_24044/m.44457 type:complete len:208 (+) Transcript_24044:134-757(+)